MRILFITHYYWPEVGAPQSRLRSAADCLRSRGHDVQILTGFPNYPTGVIPASYRGKLFHREELDGIPIARAWILPAANEGFVRRLLNHLSFAASSVVASVFLGPFDLVIAESPPLFIAASGVLISRLKRARLLLSIADLWPEMAVAIGALTSPPMIRAAEWLEGFVYGSANHIIALTASYKSFIEAKGVGPEKVSHVPNGVDVGRFGPEELSDLARQSIPAGRFVVMYTGTISPTHALDTVLDAAALIQRSDLSESAPGDENILFAFVGDGTERGRLEARARELNLDNVLFAGAFPAEEMPGFLARTDVCMNSCVAGEIFERAVPRKTVEYLASGKPLIMAGELRELIEEYDTGIWVPPEQPEELARAVLGLYHDPELRRRCGANARRCAEERYSSESVCEKYQAAVAAAVKP